MSIVSELTYDEWERIGGFKGIESYVDGVVQLWGEGEEYPIDSDEVNAIRCGEDVSRHVDYQYWRRDEDDSAVWYLEDAGNDHLIRQTIRHGSSRGHDV